MLNTRKKGKMLLVTLIFTIIHISLISMVGIVLMFNLFGIVDKMDYILQTYVAKDMSISSMLTSYYFELLFAVIINFAAARLYYKGYKYGATGNIFGRRVIMESIFQILFSAYIPGLLALITGIIMVKQKRPFMANAEQTEAYINETKLAAMSEAVARLKELRESGAISEEEYYANINKILES